MERNIWAPCGPQLPISNYPLEFIYQALPEIVKADLPEIYFMPDLVNHSQTRNLTRKLIERGFSDEDIEKILYGNFMRIFRELL